MSISYIPPEKFDELADAIRKAANATDTQFIDITRLAKAWGCDVYEVDFTDDDISGTFEIIEGKCIIRVRRNDPESRKRFTIAHELAHSILHKNNHTNTAHIDYRRPRHLYTDDELKKEIQANMLAASLLMPKKLVTQVWQRYKDIDDVAHIFHVSKSAAAVRLDSLGLLD